ncbi:MAG: hypothetical protein ACFFEF_17195 [Candidatus Thorarchaeota archaeon]
MVTGLGNRTHEAKATKIIRQNPARVYIVLAIIIASLITAPVAYSFWAASQQPTIQTLTFHLMSQDTSWFNGTGHISFEDGSVEILTSWHAMPRYDSDDVTQIGWESWMPVERTFQEPEECRFDYSCIGMNITVGPFIFMSNQAQMLYQDSQGRTIETWYGYLGS